MERKAERVGVTNKSINLLYADRHVSLASSYNVTTLLLHLN